MKKATANNVIQNINHVAVSIFINLQILVPVHKSDSLAGYT